MYGFLFFPMRFLALQTDIRQLKKQFLVEGEEEILTTMHHPFVFLASAVRDTFFLLCFAAFLGLIASFLGSSAGIIIGFVFLFGFLVYFFFLLGAYIRWHYNFLIVTTEKIVIVKHRSFTYHNVNPIHLEDIERTKFESQFFGIWRCGTIHILLKEREGGTTRVNVLRYIPQPDVVASAIENAIGLAKQRSQGESVEHQLSKVQKVQEKIQESVKHESSSNPTVLPPSEPPADDAVRGTEEETGV
ncbi:hypothetical protein A3D88_03515 [Candidatus Peribacteria bacterium RIFCSPHIGHO2_02_FULL_52_16]|nr:MAG: hypothetical protein A2706_04330 [Candidatus Peribacteria bacterium RIFCSPHIGHO2_01_FULL_51_35]OGJ61753.1 MAG: hypothetical protein A3D88_03515 [Candidatus Peribacteria bacterium RIFCSPHIGHO2_02_FULL_52_16]